MDEHVADAPADAEQTSDPQPQSRTGADTNRIGLRLICTADLHMHLRFTEPAATASRQGYGLAGLADVIHKARREASNALLLDAGDTFQGSTLADFMVEDGDPEHPMVAAMNRLGYDAATLGNHDFDYGAAFLRDALDGARFPVVVSNLARGTGLGGVVRQRLLLDRRLVDSQGGRHRIGIGIVGLAPAQVHTLSASGARVVATQPDLTGAARDAGETLRARGANLVVLLFHGGFGPEDGADVEQFAAAAGADAVVMGHQHRLFPDPALPETETIDPAHGTVGGVPAVMPGFWASHLGMIDLTLARRGGTWRAVGGRASLRPNRLPQTEVSPSAQFVANLSRRIERRFEQVLDREIGTVSAPVHSYFSLVHCDLATRLSAQASLDALSLHVPDGPAASLPRLAVATAFKAGGRGGLTNYFSVPGGRVLERGIRSFHPFQNHFCAVEVSGTQLRRWLEATATLFNRVTDCGSSLLISRTARSYHFDTIYGLTYAFDVGAPAGARLRDLRHDGRPVDAQDRFLLATTDYRLLNPPDGVGPLSTIGLRDRPAMQAVLRDWIAARSPVDLSALPPVWRFEPLGGIDVEFATHPAARGFLDELAACDARTARIDRDGFLRLTLTL